MRNINVDSAQAPGAAGLSIKSLQLSTRVTNALLGAGLDSVEKLRNLTASDFRILPNIGDSSVNEILSALQTETENDIPSLGLSVRSTNALMAYGIRTAEQLALLTELDLHKIPNLGSRSITEILNVIEPLKLPDNYAGPASLRELGLKTSNYSRLRSAGITTVLELYQFHLTRGDIKNIDGIDLNEIDNCLEDTGFPIRFGHQSGDLGNTKITHEWIEPYPEDLSVIALHFFCSNVGEVALLRQKKILNACHALSALSQSKVNPRTTEFRVCSKLRKQLFATFESASEFRLEIFLQVLTKEGLRIFPSRDASIFTSQVSYSVKLKMIFEWICTEALKKEDREIALARIWMPGGEQATLEVLGKQRGVTRERVRQIEKKALKIFCDFFWDSEGAYIHRGKIVAVLHPTLQAPLSTLRSKLSTTEEIEIVALREIIAESFKVKVEDIIEALPFLLCLIQGTTQSHQSKMVRSGESERLFNIEKYCSTTKISDLRLPNLTTNNLHKRGIFYAGELVTLKEKKTSPAVEKAVSVASSIAEQLKEKSGFPEEAFVRALGLQTLDRDEDGQNENTDHLLKLIGQLVPHVTSWQHCDAIYAMRTSHSAETRATLGECAKTLFGRETPSNIGSILRSEKHLVERLAAILVNRDFRFAQVWVPGYLIDAVQDCKKIFDESYGDFDQFKETLMPKSSTSAKNSSNFASLIWIILSGSTADRYFHLRQGAHIRRRVAQQAPTAAGATIKLRGFRAKH